MTFGIGYHGGRRKPTKLELEIRQRKKERREKINRWYAEFDADHNVQHSEPARAI